MCDLLIKQAHQAGREISVQSAKCLFLKEDANKRKYTTPICISMESFRYTQCMRVRLCRNISCLSKADGDLCWHTTNGEKQTHNLFKWKKRKEKTIHEHNNQPIRKIKQQVYGFVLMPHVHWAAMHTSASLSVRHLHRSGICSFNLIYSKHNGLLQNLLSYRLGWWLKCDLFCNHVSETPALCWKLVISLC